ncbi:hypothetical protein [Pseudomonas sp. PSKL.D1]|uniref:hypothetical protein n=1 Tax=Pseudomonas sp. PSKL.D1 TaxID=3029060 RepID=UPI002381265E|nr:hypothetical protein [Pseudomonas sp. PSKL.D1]WDY55882.1 hypothetical protein PVV54_14860 [Pseudomonas sp. PSKL.D1]
MPISTTVYAQGGWVDGNGRLLPDTDYAKSRQGFSASLFITSDSDWNEKWNTSPGTTPRFKTASEVSKNGELFILTFLANPKLDSTGMTDVSCDFTVTRPDGSRSLYEQGLPCFKTRLTTAPTLVYLTSAAMKFVADIDDPSGSWSVDVIVRDHLRGLSIPLHTSFIVR